MSLDSVAALSMAMSASSIDKCPTSRQHLLSSAGAATATPNQTQLAIPPHAAAISRQPGVCTWLSYFSLCHCKHNSLLSGYSVSLVTSTHLIRPRPTLVISPNSTHHSLQFTTTRFTSTRFKMGNKASMMLQEEEIQAIQEETGCK